MIVVDPWSLKRRRWLKFITGKPGTDAWLFAAMVAMLVQNEHMRTWVSDGTTGR